MTVTVGAPGTSRMQRALRTDRWGIARAVLLIGIAAMALATWISGGQHVSFRDLRGDIASGRTHRVEVYGGLPPDAHGEATMAFRWNAGGHSRLAEVTAVNGDGGGMSAGSETVVRGDVSEQLIALSPRRDLQVARATTDLTVGTQIAGWQTPDWIAPAAILLWLAALVVLVNGPQPRFGTRWAWFWMIATPVSVVGLPAFLLVSGPWRPDSAAGAAGQRWRLTGGKAFLLSFVICSVLGLAWSTP